MNEENTLEVNDSVDFDNEDYYEIQCDEFYSNYLLNGII